MTFVLPPKTTRATMRVLNAIAKGEITDIFPAAVSRHLSGNPSEKDLSETSAGYILAQLHALKGLRSIQGAGRQRYEVRSDADIPCAIETHKAGLYAST